MLASLQLAVVLIAVYAAVLAAATFIESWYGSRSGVVQFFVYEAWWFELLNVLLALNVLLSAVVRWPWRRRHIGFLLTHAGILLLLLGFWVGNRWGVDSQLIVYEGQASSEALSDQLALHVEILPREPDTVEDAGAESQTQGNPTVLDIPFHPGPFDWERYYDLGWIPWHLVGHDEGTIHEQRDLRIEAIDFQRGDWQRGTTPPRVRLRVIVDGARETFWIRALPYGMPPRPGLPDSMRQVVEGDGRSVAVSMPRGVIDLGFEVYLHRFHRKLDPGAETVSHYYSTVDFRAAEDQPLKDAPADDAPVNTSSDKDGPSGEVLADDVIVTLNAPISLTDPHTGRSYRIYQSGYDGPFVPGQPEFDQLVGGSSMRDQLYLSRLSVNHDPGRGLKYVGALVLSIGIVMTFYLRGVFRTRRSKVDQT